MTDYRQNSGYESGRNQRRYTDHSRYARTSSPQHSTAQSSRRQQYARQNYGSGQQSYGSHQQQQASRYQRSPQRAARPVTNQSIYTQPSGHAGTSGRMQSSAYSRSMTPAYASGQAARREQKSDNPRTIMIMIIIIVVLALVIGIRFFVNRTTIAELNSTTAAISEQQAKVDELTSTNNDLQTQMESMQGTIDAYNALK